MDTDLIRRFTYFQTRYWRSMRYVMITTMEEGLFMWSINSQVSFPEPLDVEQVETLLQYFYGYSMVRAMSMQLRSRKRTQFKILPKVTTTIIPPLNLNAMLTLMWKGIREKAAPLS